MEKNPFLPRGLPLVYDRLLIRQYKTYRLLADRLARSAGHLVEEVKTYVNEALTVIEMELAARNLKPA